MKLNLGCADRHFPGWVNVDRVAPADVIADLSIAPWPWETSSVDEIRAYDIIEHLGNTWKPVNGNLVLEYGRIRTMNEIWRVLKPGGRVEIEVPNAARGAGQIQDPTHTAAWCLNSFQYFQNGSFAHNRLAVAYGIQARFDVISLTEREYRDVHESVWKIHAVLQAVKG